LPEELSPWDREFLEGLYGMTLDSITQRSQLRDRMFQDLVR
jgi:hypothetical protein